jgi:CHAD domain-containing protein
MGDKPALRPGEPVGSALVAIARDILAEARVALGEIDRNHAVAVHDYRKAMKRWRAFLRLLEPLVGLEARSLRIDARDLARHLAGARDIQAMLDALSDLEKAEHGLSQTSFATMRVRLEDAKRAAEITALTSDLRAELTAVVVRATRVVDNWPLADLGFAGLASELARHYRRARDAIPAWAQADADDLHDLRQRVVEHRYQMELIEPLWPRMGKLWVAEAQRLRDRLGSHQDLVVLGGATAPHQPLAPWRSRLAPAIDARKAAHVAAAQRLAARLFAERPKAFRRRIEALWDAAAAVRPKPAIPPGRAARID